jgi:HD-like signal output (HDOD) protein/GGDEF domain-containing protein
MTDSTAILDCLTARASQLYTLPSVAMRVLELTADPQVDTRALKDCIENDPALTSKILRVVNSSLFGLSRQVSDLNQALSLLGTKPLKLLVLGFSLPSGMFLGVEGKTLTWYWRHTLTKAVAGREISQTLLGVPGDDVFIAGLLQDLGILLLLQQVGEPYARFLDKALSGGLDLAAMETEAIGFTHTALTSRLLAHWGLPKGLVDAVGHSEGVSHAPRSLERVLHFAELVARLLVDGQPGALPQLLEAGWANHLLTEAQLEGLVENLEEKVQQLAAIFSLQLPGGVEYRDVLAAAHRQLAPLASQATEALLRTGQGSSWGAEEDLLLGELQELADAISRVCPRTPNVPHAGPADRTVHAPRADDVNRGTHAMCAVASHTAARTSASHRQAPADDGLLGRLKLAVAACRQARCPLSLVLVQLAHKDEVLLAMGEEGLEGVQRVTEAICRHVDHPRSICIGYGDAGFALILPDCDRRHAVELADELLRSMRRLAPGGSPARAVALAVGAATVSLPPKNFPPQDLLSGADRCLYGSHASGGGVVKSIECY